MCSKLEVVSRFQSQASCISLSAYGKSKSFTTRASFGASVAGPTRSRNEETEAVSIRKCFAVELNVFNDVQRLNWMVPHHAAPGPGPWVSAVGLMVAQNSQGTPMERASERQTGRFGCRFERRGSPAVQKCTLPWMLNRTNDKRITSITRISWSSENLVSLGEDPTWGWLTLNMHRLYVYLWLGSPSQKQLKFNVLGWDSGTDCSCDRTRCLTRPTKSAFF